MKKVHGAYGIQSKETISVLWEFQKKEKGIESIVDPLTMQGLGVATPMQLKIHIKLSTPPKVTT